MFPTICSEFLTGIADAHLDRGIALSCRTRCGSDARLYDEGRLVAPFADTFESCLHLGRSRDRFLDASTEIAQQLVKLVGSGSRLVAHVSTLLEPLFRRFRSFLSRERRTVSVLACGFLMIAMVFALLLAAEEPAPKLKAATAHV